MSKAENESNGQESWQESIVNKLLGQSWKNTYFRLFCLSEFMLNVDSIVLLTSNYRLHYALTSEIRDGQRIFPFSFLIDLHPFIKLLASLFVPALILTVYYLAAEATLRFNDRMKKVSQETSKSLAIRKLKSEVAVWRDISLRASERERNIKGSYLEAYRLAVDLCAYLIHKDQNFKKDFAIWYEDYRKTVNRFVPNLKSFLGEEDFARLAGPYEESYRRDAVNIMNGHSDADSENGFEADRHHEEMMNEEVVKEALAIERSELNLLVKP